MFLLANHYEVKLAVLMNSHKHDLRRSGHLHGVTDKKVTKRLKISEKVFLSANEYEFKLTILMNSQKPDLQRPLNIAPEDHTCAGATLHAESTSD